MPEFYNLAQQDTMQGREAYPLRPGERAPSSNARLSTCRPSLEHIESLMYVYKATEDDTFLFMAADIVDAIESCCKTSCGYTSVSRSSSLVRRSSIGVSR
jgi:ER degradation enhancer, mannosidase alpha-like 2